MIKNLYFNKYIDYGKMNDHVVSNVRKCEYIKLLIRKTKIHYVIGTRFQKFSIILKDYY